MGAEVDCTDVADRLRDRNPGLVLMGIGFFAVLFAVINKASELFS